MDSNRLTLARNMRVSHLSVTEKTEERGVTSETPQTTRNVHEVLIGMGMSYDIKTYTTFFTFYGVRGTITDNGAHSCTIIVRDGECGCAQNKFSRADIRGRRALKAKLSHVAAFFNVDADLLYTYTVNRLDTEFVR